MNQLERRKDAQLAREIEISLPRDLAPDDRSILLRNFVQTEFVDRGMVADIAIHNCRARDGGEQPHAHVLLSLRSLDSSGFGNKNRDWNKADTLIGWRQAWACHVNRSLDRHNLVLPAADRVPHVDHRSHEVRGLTLEPEPKLGPHVAAIERSAHRRAGAGYQPKTERMALWLKVQTENRQRVRLSQELAQIERAWQHLRQLIERLFAILTGSLIKQERLFGRSTSHPTVARHKSRSRDLGMER